MAENKKEYLQQVEVLQDLSSDELLAINNKTHLRQYNADYIFYMPEDTGEVLFLLKKGRVQLYRISPDGRKLVLATLYPGAMFGHMALVGQRLQNTYAQSLDDCTICAWSRDEVEETLKRNPDFALRVIEALGNRLSEAEDKLTDVTFKRLPARLAALLIQLCDETRSCELTGFTHQYLADILGTYRETVTQILNDFKNKGTIELGRKLIHILDISLLEEIANADW